MSHTQKLLKEQAALRLTRIKTQAKRLRGFINANEHKAQKLATGQAISAFKRSRVKQAKKLEGLRETAQNKAKANKKTRKPVSEQTIAKRARKKAQNRTEANKRRIRKLALVILS